MVARGVAWALAFAMAVGCGVDRIEKPVVPIAEDIRDLYEPTTALTEDEFEEIGQLISDILDIVVAVEALLDFLRSIVEDLELPGEPLAAPGRSNITFTGTGFTELTYVCSGSEGSEPDADTTGTIEILVPFTNAGLDEASIGAAFTCEDSFAGVNFVLSGILGMVLERDGIPLSELDTEPIIFAFSDLLLTVDDGTVLDEDTLSVRDCSAGSPDCPANNIEFPLHLEDGIVVLFINANNTAGGLYDTNGLWACNFTNRVCTSEEGEGEFEF